MSKGVLILFKDHKELREWGTEYLLPVAKRDDDFQYFDRHSDTHYKLGLMERSTTIGRNANDVYFVNCSLDDCKDEEFLIDLQMLESWGANIHRDPKATEEFQSELERIASFWNLYEFCASGELRCYRQEMAMKKLSEEFALKQDENAMEICRGFLEKYENGTLEEYLEQ